MSISSVTGSTAYQPTAETTGRNQVRKDFKAIQSALDKGDTKSAQSALSDLMQLLSGSSSSSSTSATSADSQSQDPLSVLAKALQSGDLQGAKDAFAALVDAMKTKGKGHHHHHKADGDADDAVSGVQGTSATQGATATSSTMSMSISMQTTDASGNTIKSQMQAVGSSLDVFA